MHAYVQTYIHMYIPTCLPTYLHTYIIHILQIYFYLRPSISKIDTLNPAQFHSCIRSYSYILLSCFLGFHIYFFSFSPSV